MSTPAVTAPIDSAEYKMPNPSGPTCRISLAKIGKSAEADEKNVARKSSSMVAVMILALNTNRIPSVRASRLICGELTFFCVAVCIRIRAMSTARNDAALIQ